MTRPMPTKKLDDLIDMYLKLRNKVSLDKVTLLIKGEVEVDKDMTAGAGLDLQQAVDGLTSRGASIRFDRSTEGAWSVELSVSSNIKAQ